MGAIRRSAKRFLLNVQNYTDFAAQDPLTKPASNTTHSSDKIYSEFAPQNRENSEITNNGTTISELTPNNSHTTDKIDNANIPQSFFALNCSTGQLDKIFNNFQQIANSFQNVLMMSHSVEETLLQIQQSNPSKVRFAHEAGVSTAPSVPATPSNPNTDTTIVTTPSTHDQYADPFNFSLSKIFLSTLMASPTSKDAILKEIRDCV